MSVPSATRAPNVPAVVAEWPVETPMGTGRGHLSAVVNTLEMTGRADARPRALIGPVTCVTTLTPSCSMGFLFTPDLAVKTRTIAAPSALSPTTVPTTALLENTFWFTYYWACLAFSTPFPFPPKTGEAARAKDTIAPTLNTIDSLRFNRSSPQWADNEKITHPD